MSGTPPKSENAGKSRSRDEKGHFLPGFAHSTGRPKGVVDRHTQAARAFAEAAMNRHAQLVDEFLSSPDQRIRLECWKFLAEYRWGKARQQIEIDVRNEALRLAEEAGVDMNELLAAVERLVPN